MQRPGAAKAHQREIARIIALLHRNHAQRAEHVLVDDVDDPARGFHQPDAQRIGNRLHRRLGPFAVELERAAQQVFRQIAQHDIGIGNGGAVPPLP
jgi:hypothetical protein